MAFVLLESPGSRTRHPDACARAWIADLRRDGRTEESIARRVAARRPAQRAVLAVPCLVMDGSHTYGTRRRDGAEREMFVVATGAGVQNSWSRWRGAAGLGVGVVDDVLPRGGPRGLDLRGLDPMARWRSVTRHRTRAAAERDAGGFIKVR
ncbi:hypothetical protein GCM10023238_16810 [Streptomyces heliomycini]